MATNPKSSSMLGRRALAVSQKNLYGYSKRTKHRDERSREQLEVSLLPISFKTAKVIGKGSTGTVLEVAVGNRKSYALKIIRNDDVQSFEEILIHKQLSHPNIIQYHSHWKEQWANTFTVLGKFGRTFWKILFQQLIKSLKVKIENCGLIFIRMECCKQTVADAISKGLYKNQTGLRLTFLGILDGVAYLHQQGIIHGDIKTENIGVNSEGQDPKLMDFGNSMLYSPNSCYEHQSDIYCTGIVFFEMFFGPLTSDERQNLICDFIRNDNLPPIQNRHGSQHFRPLLKAMLDQSEDENPTAEELRNFEFIQPTAEKLQNSEYFQPTSGVGASKHCSAKIDLPNIFNLCSSFLCALQAGNILGIVCSVLCVVIIILLLVLDASYLSSKESYRLCRSSIFCENRWTCRKKDKFLSVSKHALSRLARY